MARGFTPRLAELVENPLYSDVWADPALSPRDRSIATVAALIALYRPEELPAHFRRARNNGVTCDELAALITHIAFYAGSSWTHRNVVVFERSQFPGGVVFLRQHLACYVVDFGKIGGRHKACEYRDVRVVRGVQGRNQSPGSSQRSSAEAVRRTRKCARAVMFPRMMRSKSPLAIPR
jgi:4-carboxymuconolactone decarboxylase